MSKIVLKKVVKITKTAKTGKYFYATGKRKTAIARVKLFEDGKGEIKIQGQDLKDFSPSYIATQKVKAPLSLVGATKNFDLEIQVAGGGRMAQMEAINHGISRVLLEYEPAFRHELKVAGFLTRDSRIKERKKPGLLKARKSPQWSKR